MKTDFNKGRNLLLIFFGLLLSPWLILVVYMSFITFEISFSSLSSGLSLYLIPMFLIYKGKKWAIITLSAFLVFGMLLSIIAPFISELRNIEWYLFIGIFCINGFVVYQLNTNKYIDAFMKVNTV